MRNKRIVVIGSGVLGAAISYYLSLWAGSNITVVEQSDLASGASGANSGQISILDRAQRWHMPLALRSLSIYKEMQLEVDLEYEQSGGGVVLQHKSQVAEVPEIIERLGAYGVPVKLLQGQRIHEFEPHLCTDSLKGLLYCPLEGKINPFRVTMMYLDRARERGVRIVSHTKVTGFKIKGSQISAIETTQGELKVDLVINAAGGWAGLIGELAGVVLPIHYHRGTALVTQAVAPMIRGPVVGANFLFPVSTNESLSCDIDFSVVQSKAGTIVIAQATEPSEPDSRATTLEGLSRMTANALQYFPCLSSLEAIRAWACVTPYTESGKPCYGFAKNISNFFTVAGFKGAFSTAPAIGEMTANDIIRRYGAR